MSNPILEQAVASTRGVLAGVQSGQMQDPTPCQSWKVSDLVNHVVGGQFFFATSVSGAPPARDPGGDFSTDDFVSAFDEGAAADLEAFEADGVMEKIVHLPFGDMPGSAFLGLAATDTFQHGWDLARATGQSTDLAPELAATLLAGARATISDSLRGADPAAPFGPEQQAPEGASNADQLAAFLGRTV